MPTIKKMKQKNEKERFIRETVIKYFFDMSKSTYTIMVLGGLAALFKIIKTDQDGTVSAIYLGDCLDYSLGYNWINNIKKIKL